MTSTSEQNTPREFVSAVERLMYPPEILVRRVREHLAARGGNLERAAHSIISEQSMSSAIAGGLAAVPAVMPGVGTALTVMGGVLTEMLYVLKMESELCMMLASLHSFDIHSPQERRLAMLLASVGTFEVQQKESALASLGIASMEAVWNYAPRETGKLLLEVVGQGLVRSAAGRSARTLFLAVPFVGIGIGAMTNKMLTQRAGVRAHAELGLRRQVLGKGTPWATSDKEPSPAT